MNIFSLFLGFDFNPEEVCTKRSTIFTLCGGLLPWLRLLWLGSIGTLSYEGTSYIADISDPFRRSAK